MKSTQATITVGLSVNPELSYSFIDQPGEKGKLSSFSVKLAGSSANIATCLKNLGHNSNLLVPSAIFSSDKGSLLDIALNQSELQHTRLKILDDSPLAIYPIGEGREGSSVLYGTKGIVTSKSELIKEAEEKIIRLDGLWRIATGVDKNIGLLAGTLLGETNKGYRTFSPHYSFCTEKHFRKFLESYLLSCCDLFILNEYEFSLIEKPFEQIHDSGVSVIVVTNGEEGGRFSLCNESTSNKSEEGFYKGVPVPVGRSIFKVGAGDWFHGALIGDIIKHTNGNGSSLLNITYDALLKACNFAAKVASKKITMEGGSNGPVKEDL